MTSFFIKLPIIPRWSASDIKTLSERVKGFLENVRRGREGGGRKAFSLLRREDAAIIHDAKVTAV